MAIKKFSVIDLCSIGIFTTIIIICAQFSIPMPSGVPMTLQTFAIPLAGIVLGAKNGTYSTLVYVLLGTLGAPVFAGFTGGLGIVFGPTGGFILSFPIIALAAGTGEAKHNNNWLVLGIVAGAVFNYICGMLFFSLVMSSNLQTAFVTCVLPYIPTAIIKMVLVTVLGKSIKSALLKSGVLA